MEHRSERIPLVQGAALPPLVLIVVCLLTAGCSSGQSANSKAEPRASSTVSQADATVELSESQLGAISIGPVETRPFPIEKQAIGNIDFDGDRTVAVPPPYQGRIMQTFADLGDDVRAGQPLYTVDSADLAQAESTLIGAAATFAAADKELARVKDLFENNGGLARKDLEEAESNQQTAEGALKAARNAVRLFGKSDGDIDQFIASRRIDTTLVVRSPIAGRITAKNAPTGQWVQPGSDSAPYTVADVSVKWMLANVTEDDVPWFRKGQALEVSIAAYPDGVFRGKVSKIGAVVDSNTRRITVRSEISDPGDELRPGMLATFVIRVHEPEESPAIPVNGVVREGDGTMTAWVTTDRHRFVQRTVKTGLQRDGVVQILDGLHPNELVVTDGAIFLSNMLQAPPVD